MRNDDEDKSEEIDNLETEKKENIEDEMIKVKDNEKN